MVHTYGDDVVDPSKLQAELEQHIREGIVPHHIPPTTHTPDGVDTILGGKRCKCGSTTHFSV